MNVQINLKYGTIKDQGLEGLIYNSWIRSFRCAASVRDVPHTPYLKGQHKLISQLLENSTCRVLLAVDVEDEGHILGWMCFEEYEGVGVIHYVYVKSTFRRFGIGTRLVGEVEGEVYYTHKNSRGDKLMSKCNASYNPYLAQRRDDEDQEGKVTSGGRD